MTGFVIDASIAVAWCLEDEATPATDALLYRARDYGAVVPALWHLEVANVVLKAEKRNRISLAGAANRLELLSALRIEIDQETPLRAWREIIGLARAERLTTYDAAYLELAVRKRLPLATLDRDLAKAARRTGTEVLS